MKMRGKIKKLICAAAAVSIAAMSTSVMADNGSSRDYAGYGAVVYSDIGAYVNHYPIASYSCGGKTVVVAEDLRNFGFNVDWNGDDRTLNITPNYTDAISGCGTVYSGAGRQGSIFAYMQNSDIKVYINGREVSAYCIGGYTLVSLEDLANWADGIEFTWDSSTRSAKLWISWNSITAWQPLPRQVIVYNEPSESVNNVSSIVGRYIAYDGGGEGMAGLEISDAGSGNLNIAYERRHTGGFGYRAGTAYSQPDGTYVAEGECYGNDRATGEYISYYVKYVLTPNANGTVTFDMYKDTGDREDVQWMFIKQND